MRWWLAGLVALGLLGGGPAGCGVAWAQKSADTLRVVWWDQIPDLDPYHTQLRAGLVVAHQAFDGLVYRDPDSYVIKPLLATSWKYLDDTTLQFNLRHDVTFQDGSRFSADDVVYTFNTILHDPQVATPSNFTWLAGAEKVDDYTVVVKLKRVFPAAMEYLAMVMPIWPMAYRERVGEAGYRAAPVGAGPYRITEIDGRNRIVMRRYDGYYAGSPKGRPAIGRVVIDEVATPQAALDQMLAGQADWTWNFIPEAFDRLAAVPGLQVTRAETMRVNYLQLDAVGRTGGDNPLTQLKVRQAIAYALDRDTIAHKLVQGGARVPDAPCFPTQFGCDTGAAARYAYDPARARALLSEAGYPGGFETEMVSYLLPQIDTAVRRNLAAVGIIVRVDNLQVAAALKRILGGEAPMNLASWGSYSINDVSAILPNFFEGGPNDYALDPLVERAVRLGGSNTNPDLRRKYYSEAIARITGQAYMIPLFTSVATYAFSRDLEFKPYTDELPRFYLSKWK
ncbi:MAG: ABC transporter substrate-binding protein [Rhodospirillales bacterium]|nr:ABC transporter substrate-binding protein [Rhodospirillales bacterium]MDE2574459.1 ABC transporter substrate-binding protein [Rhodospirillales bacterium]